MTRSRDRRARPTMPSLLAALVIVALLWLVCVGAAAGATASPLPSPASSGSPPSLGAPPPLYSPAPVGSPAPGSGGAIYAANCSGCHGPQGQGNIGPSQQADAFPSLVAGMVERGGISMPRLGRGLTPQQIRAVAEFVATSIADPVARTATAASGGVIFRIYCSGCHGETGRGGALVAGKNAPSLARYPAAEAIAAMIYGRTNMPVFADTALDVRQQAAVALYVQTLERPTSPGGSGLGYVGPVSEGLMGYLGLAVLVAFAGWLSWGKGGGTTLE